MSGWYGHLEGEGRSASVSIRDGAHATRRHLKPCPHVLTSLAMFQVSITVAAAEGDNTELEPNEGMSGTSVTVERRPAQEQARRRMCLKSPLMASASPGAGKAGAAGTEGTKKPTKKKGAAKGGSKGAGGGSSGDAGCWPG